MKKAYSKPVLAVESFQLDAAIATSCSSEGKAAIGYNENTCLHILFQDYAPPDNEPAGEGQYPYFTDDTCVIDLDGPDNVENDGMCYHRHAAPSDFGLFIYS